jgi:hypothetical protein
MHYALPTWLEDALGEPVEPHLLWTDTKRFILSHPDEPDQFFDDVEKAYDSVDSAAVRIDASLLDQDFGFYTVPTSSKSGTHRMLMGHDDYSTLWSLEEDLHNFLDVLYTRYVKDPTSFIAAYDFLDYHPAFWIRHKQYEPIARQGWSTDKAVARMQIYPRGLNVGHTFVIEYGEHATPDYTQTYFDDELMDNAATYEELILDAARNVENLFWPTGERKGEQTSAEALSEDDFHGVLASLKRWHLQNVAQMDAEASPYS